MHTYTSLAATRAAVHIPNLATRANLRTLPCAQFMCLQLIVGLREVNTIALSWILIAMTMFFGLAQETWSRPAPRDPDGYRGWLGDPPRTNEIMAIEEKRRTHRDRNYVQRPEGPSNYPYAGTLEDANSAQRYNYSQQQATGPPPAPLEPFEKKILRDYAMKYTYNYFYRLIPHFVGWFPYVAAWTVYFNHFLTQLNDLRKEDEALFERVPDFVPYAVGGTCIFFTSFTFVQWRYQYISPDFCKSHARAPTQHPHTDTHAPFHRLENGTGVLLPERIVQALPRVTLVHEYPGFRLIRRGSERQRRHQRHRQLSGVTCDGGDRDG